MAPGHLAFEATPNRRADPGPHVVLHRWISKSRSLLDSVYCICCCKSTPQQRRLSPEGLARLHWVAVQRRRETGKSKPTTTATAALRRWMLPRDPDLPPWPAQKESQGASNDLARISCDLVPCSPERGFGRGSTAVPGVDSSNGVNDRGPPTPDEVRQPGGLCAAQGLCEQTLFDGLELVGSPKLEAAGGSGSRGRALAEQQKGPGGPTIGFCSASQPELSPACR